MPIAWKTTSVVPSKSLVGRATALRVMLHQLKTSGQHKVRDFNDLTATQVGASQGLKTRHSSLQLSKLETR